jgi:hypothetical protein
MKENTVKRKISKKTLKDMLVIILSFLMALIIFRNWDLIKEFIIQLIK